MSAEVLPSEIDALSARLKRREMSRVWLFAFWGACVFVCGYAYGYKRGMETALSWFINGAK